MRMLWAGVIGLALAWSVPGCGKGGGEAPAGEGGVVATAEGAAAGEGAAGGLELEERTIAYEVRRDVDQRELVMSTRVVVPKGWEPDPKADTAGHKMTTLLPGGGVAAANPFALSNVTVSATCHGQCTADKLPEQIKNVAAEQLRYAGSGAKIVKDEQLGDGVWGFVIEADKGDGAKAHTFGVTHWDGPAWPFVIFCNGHFQREFADAWPAAYEACAKAVVTVEDPLMPAEVLERERAQLAKCPSETKLTYRADPVREGEPTELGPVVSVYAHASSPGHVAVYVANFELVTTRLSRQPLEGDQRVLRLGFEHRREGEVLSGSYPTGYDGDQRVGLGLHVAGGTTLSWDPHRAEGAVEIIARTPDRVCGRVAIKGGNRGDIEGEFVADLEIGGGK